MTSMLYHAYLLHNGPMKLRKTKF